MHIDIKCKNCIHFTTEHYPLHGCGIIHGCDVKSENYVPKGSDDGFSDYHLNWNIYNKMMNEMRKD